MMSLRAWCESRGVEYRHAWRLAQRAGRRSRLPARPLSVGGRVTWVGRPSVLDRWLAANPDVRRGELVAC